jgi:hypothetical protein
MNGACAPIVLCLVLWLYVVVVDSIVVLQCLQVVLHILLLRVSITIINRGKGCIAPHLLLGLLQLR